MKRRQYTEEYKRDVLELVLTASNSYLFNSL